MSKRKIERTNLKVSLIAKNAGVSVMTLYRLCIVLGVVMEEYNSVDEIVNALKQRASELLGGSGQEDSDSGDNILKKVLWKRESEDIDRYITVLILDFERSEFIKKLVGETRYSILRDYYFLNKSLDVMAIEYKCTPPTINYHRIKAVYKIMRALGLHKKGYYTNHKLDVTLSKSRDV